MNSLDATVTSVGTPVWCEEYQTGVLKLNMIAGVMYPQLKSGTKTVTKPSL